ncbi:MAG: DUF2851 family protein [Flavobacteriaceae bacterium]|nr:DUF2851 family protein [Flavobacteriaceae bacterium]
MKEDFIEFIWKHQYFLKDNLQTSNGDSLQIVKVGEKNINAGPDFFNAQIVVNGQKWAGNVELHVNSSDWYVHGHENDTNYDNVILHVVWVDDAPIFRKDNSLFTCLELSQCVDQTLLTNYREIFSAKQKWIPCESKIRSIDPFLLNSWLERLYFERLEQKSGFILDLLKKSNNDWEAVLFQLLAKNFGLKVNGDAFFIMAKNLNFSILRKEATLDNHLEALFFGQAGLLQDENENEYYHLLKDQYKHQLNKYNLTKMNVVQVEYFRLRPNNFPTIRIAQLASLYERHQNLFSKIIEIKNLNAYYKLFDVSASSYWDTHYTFKAKSSKRSKRLTKSFIDLLLINTVIPIKFIYQKSIGRPDHKEILALMEAITSEKNSIVEKFKELGVHSDSAFSSQSLLQLKNEYCKKHACLNCQIGAKLLQD